MGKTDASNFDTVTPLRDLVTSQLELQRHRSTKPLLPGAGPTRRGYASCCLERIRQFRTGIVPGSPASGRARDARALSYAAQEGHVAGEGGLLLPRRGQAAR